jgi:hypothetical protein
MRHFFYLLIPVILWSCIGNNDKEAGYTVLTGATIIDGTGGDPIENGVFIIEGNKIKEIIERMHAKKLPSGPR